METSNMKEPQEEVYATFRRLVMSRKKEEQIEIIRFILWGWRCWHGIPFSRV